MSVVWALVFLGGIGAFAYWATRYRDQVLREQATPARARAPVPLRLGVVDIGSMRYFDARTFPALAFFDPAPALAAKASVATLGPVTAHAWLVPGEVGVLLDGVLESARVAALRRLAEPAAGGKAMVTFVHLVGARPSPRLEASAKAAGVSLMLELGVRVGPGGTESDLVLLDRAASS